MIRKKRRMWKFKKVQKEVLQAVKKATRRVERKLAKGSKRCPQSLLAIHQEEDVEQGHGQQGDEQHLNNHYCRSFTREDLSQMP